MICGFDQTIRTLSFKEAGLAARNWRSTQKPSNIQRLLSPGTAASKIPWHLRKT
jgi:hypothetical protein